ncbi:phosphotransferase [Sorangium sp. So ce291]|uniref:phosphotransferase n=1 Tax=Sorangium sp. So ce291 TaxID=3133294 RepID=UPI003F5D563E
MDAKLECKIREFYGFERLTLLDRLGGLSAVNLKVQLDAGLFVLKRFRSNNEEDVFRMEAVTALLDRSSLPVSLPLAGKGGALHFELDGRYHALFPFVEGMTLHEPSLTAPSLSSAAILLSQLHRVDVPQSVGLMSKGESRAPAEVFRDTARAFLARACAIPLEESTRNLIKQLIKAKVRMLAILSKARGSLGTPTARHLVHGDFHNENLIFDSEGNVVRVLDFEETHLNHRVRDVFSFINHACCNTGFGSANMEKATLFLRSYNAMYALTDQEVEGGAIGLIEGLCSSLFLERVVVDEGNAELISILERDLRKVNYFATHAETWISELRSAGK